MNYIDFLNSNNFMNYIENLISFITKIML